MKDDMGVFVGARHVGSTRELQVELGFSIVSRCYGKAFKPSVLSKQCVRQLDPRDELCRVDVSPAGNGVGWQRGMRRHLWRMRKLLFRAHAIGSNIPA
jgi:hypothetical protein